MQPAVFSKHGKTWTSQLLLGKSIQQPINLPQLRLESANLWQNSDFEAAHVEEDVGIVLIQPWELKTV